MIVQLCGIRQRLLFVTFISCDPKCSSPTCPTKGNHRWQKNRNVLKMHNFDRFSIWNNFHLRNKFVPLQTQSFHHLAKSYVWKGHSPPLWNKIERLDGILVQNVLQTRKVASLKARKPVLGSKRCTHIVLSCRCQSVQKDNPLDGLFCRHHKQVLW